VQWLWIHAINLILLAKPYFPTIRLAPSPTPAEIANFTPTTPDSLDTCVLEEHGNRLPPPFRHHVKDNLWADIAPLLHLHHRSQHHLVLYSGPSHTVRYAIHLEMKDVALRIALIIAFEVS
jgi:hypothetical protein